MSKNRLSLGIDLVGGEARLAVVETTEAGPVLHSTQTARADDLARVLRGLPRRPAAVASAVPLEQSAVRILSLPATAEDNLERVVSLEAEAALPLESEELALAHHVLGMTEQSRLEVLLVAARHAVVREALRRVNCLPWVSTSVTVSSIALVNAVQHLHAGSREPVVAVLRIEHGESELLVLERGRILLARYIPVGCAVEVEAPVEQPVAVAAGGGWEGGAEPSVVAPVLPWIAAVSQQLRYALQSLSYERGVTIERLYLCGEGAAQSGADWQLSERLDVAVSPLTPQASGGADGARYAIAFGCALEAAGSAGIPLNLTPARVSMAREVEQRRQTTFSWGALAAAVVIAGGLVFGAAVHNSQQRLATVQEQLDAASSLRGVAAAPATELKDAAAAIEEAVETRVPASQMLSVLSQALPQGTWLGELTYNAGTGCVVRGYSLNMSGAQEAQIALLRRRLFDEVTLDYRTEDRLNNVPVWSFQLSCKLRPEERRRGARR